MNCDKHQHAFVNVCTYCVKEKIEADRAISDIHTDASQQLAAIHAVVNTDADGMTTLDYVNDLKSECGGLADALDKCLRERDEARAEAQEHFDNYQEMGELFAQRDRRNADLEAALARISESSPHDYAYAVVNIAKNVLSAPAHPATAITTPGDAVISSNREICDQKMWATQRKCCPECSHDRFPFRRCFGCGCDGAHEVTPEERVIEAARRVYAIGGYMAHVGKEVCDGEGEDAYRHIVHNAADGCPGCIFVEALAALDAARSKEGK